MSERKPDVASLSSFTALWHTWAFVIIWKNLLAFTCQNVPSERPENPQPIEKDPSTLQMRSDANDKENAYMGYHISFT